MIALEEKFDFIVVGAGSAGCVLANRLTADSRNRVLLIEAGGPDTNIWIHLPVGYFKTMHNPATDWCFVTEPCPGLGGRRVKWPRGKVLGGSSAINGLLYIRGHRSDFDTWRQQGNTGWGYEDVLPYFRRSENQERGEDEFHGVGGPLAVSDVRVKREISELFISAAENAGLPRNEDVNGATQEGVGYFQNTVRNGLRCSTAVGYLKPVKHRKNLTVVTKAQATRVLIEGGRAVGVEYMLDGVSLAAHAQGEVLLASGAIGSPQLLMLSGIGPAAHLMEHGIKVLHPLPGVGKNLQDHLQVRMVFKLNRPLSVNDEVHRPFGKVAMALEFALRRRGPITMAASQVCLFAHTRPGLEAPDIQLHVQPLSADSPGEGLHKFSAFTVSPCQTRPESRGEILLDSAEPLVYPKIHPNYLATDLDCRTAVAGMQLVRQIIGQEPLAGVIASEYAPGREVGSEDALLDAARRTGQTIYHPVGTAKMGRDEMSVVDDRLRVIGIQGLRVVDASVMPTITTGNTNAAAIMIAEKGSDMILEDAKAKT